MQFKTEQHNKLQLLFLSCINLFSLDSMDVLFTFVFFVACVIMTNSPQNFSPVLKYIQFSINCIFLENSSSRFSDLLPSGLVIL